MSEIRNTYAGLKNNFRATAKNEQIRLNAQQMINESHFKKSMAHLKKQFAETERQRRIQQSMLAKHYQHQKEILKQRHNELLKLKREIQNIQQHENNQIDHEEKLQQRHQRLMEIQNDYDIRKAKIHSNRQLLEQRKKSILNEMQKFNELTQSMSKLNFNADDLTETQKKDLDDFVAKHPQTMVDDYSYRNYHQFRNSLQNEFDSDDYYDTDKYADKYSRKSRKRKHNQNIRRSILRELSRSQSPSPSPSKIRKHSRKRKRKRQSIREFTRSQSPVIRRQSRKRKRKRKKSSKIVSNIVNSIKRINNKSQTTSRSKRYDKTKRKSRPSKQKKKVIKDTEIKSEKHIASKKSGNLYVRLVNARDVFGEKGSKINTYVELDCNGQVYTSSIKKSRNPEWNELFKFYVNDYDKNLLTVRLIDTETDRSIAKMKIPVCEFVDKQHSSQDYVMNDELSMNLDIGYEEVDKMGTIGTTGCDMLRKSILQMK